MQYKINISIDDVSPHPLSSTKVIQKCDWLTYRYPDIKFTLFVPISYWRTMYTGGVDSRSTSPLQIDQFGDFCKILKNLPDKNYEIAYHGYYHGIPQVSNNDEFKNLSYEASLEKYGMMFDIAKKAGLEKKFKMIFRPPAWKMSAGAIKAAADVGIEILALSPKDSHKQTYNGADEDFKSVVYYNVNPPFEELALYEKTEMVFHACEWDKNYFSNLYISQLDKLFAANRKKIEFCFIGDL